MLGIRKALKAGVKRILGHETRETSRPAVTPEEVAPARAAAPVPRNVPDAEAPRARPAPIASEKPPVEEVSVAKVEAHAEDVEVHATDAETSAEAAEAHPNAIEIPADDTAGNPLTPESVQSILDEMVRPALQGDGGDIQFVRIEGNDVYVRLVGSCSSCPSSVMTMKMGVERLLQEEFPSMGQLIQVDDAAH